jgi:hypothetical protein
MDSKSNSASVNHKSNHHSNYSDRDFAGGKSASKKIDSLKNKLYGNIHNIQPRHKIPLKLPIPFP